MIRAILLVDLILSVLLPNLLVAQECAFPRRYTSSTHWERFQNNAAYPNDFDWTSEYFDMYLHDSQTPVGMAEQVRSPFYAGGTLYMDNIFHLQDPNDYEEKDFHYYEGWELVYKEFGRCCSESDRVDYPFFVMYNKYRGTLRVFVMVREKDLAGSFDEAMLEINWAERSRSTALFQHMNRITQSFDQFDPKLNNHTPNRYLNKNYYWLHADFAVAYDPCTCELGEDRQPQLSIKIKLLNTVDLELKGSIEGTIAYEDIVTQDPSNQEPSLDGGQISIGPISTSFNDLTEAYESGQRYYNEWSGYASQFDSWFDQQDSRYKQNVITNWYSASNGGSASYSAMEAAFNTFKSDPNNQEELLGLRLDDPTIGVLRTVTSAIPYAGYVWGIYDFFNSGGREESGDGANSRQTPMAFEAELNITGDINDETILDEPIIKLPGAAPRSEGPSQPIYNNVLGVVNLVEMPTMEYHAYLPVLRDNFGNTYTNLAGPEIRQFKLSGLPKIAVNPAIGIEFEQVEAAFVIEYEDDFMETFDLTGPPYENFKFDYSNYEPLIVGNVGNLLTSQRFTALQQMGFYLDYMHEDYGDPETTMRLRTDYVPFECVDQLSFPLMKAIYVDGNPTPPGLKMPKLYLKVAYRYRPIQEWPEDEVKTPIVMIHTYEIANAFEEAQRLEETGTYSARTTWSFNEPSEVNQVNFPMYIEEVDQQVFHNPYLNGSVALNTQNGSLYIGSYHTGAVFHNEVTIAGNATVSNGSDIVAAREIYVAPNSNLEPSSMLRLNGIANNGCGRSLESVMASSEEIANKCNSSAYEESVNYYTKRGDNSTQSYQLGNTLHQASNEIQVYPNPVSPNHLLRINGIQEFPVQIRLLDVSGALIQQAELHSTFLQLNSSVTSGMYVLELQTSEQVTTKKLIVR